MGIVEMKGYNLDSILDDDLDIIEALKSEFENESTSYICDMISELADSYTPIYYSDIWKNAYDISEFIEQAISEGLVDMSDFDLTKAFQAGYYQYYTQVLYNNYEIVAFNAVAKDINKHLEQSNKEYDVDLIESAIETELALFDNNDIISNYKDIVSSILERIEDEEFQEI